MKTITYIPQPSILWTCIHAAAYGVLVGTIINLTGG